VTNKTNKLSFLVFNFDDAEFNYDMCDLQPPMFCVII
jgi:hypothetical protein